MGNVRALVKKAEEVIHVYHEETGKPKVMHHVHGSDREIPDSEFQEILGRGRKKRGLLGRLMGKPIQFEVPRQETLVDRGLRHLSGTMDALGKAPNVTHEAANLVRSGGGWFGKRVAHNDRKLMMKHLAAGGALGVAGMGGIGLAGYLHSKKNRPY